ncbi:MAG: CHAP domain-containing protein [Oscillospiraceae bacterium]|jgi:surface antigen|nr:CHAP domain-containing protein [Oscillospiraceae bacterium]
MALQNYAPQKNLILGMGNSLADLNGYAGALNQFAQNLGSCWAGNADKAVLFQAIDAQMRDVNSLRQNVNWVQQAANWALEKINELGSLLGLVLPRIPLVPSIAVPGAALHQRIQLDTVRLRQAADCLQAQRGRLGGCGDAVCQTQQGLDAVLQGVFGIGGKLKSSAACTGAVLARHDRLVAAVRRIAEIYDAADGRIGKRAEELAGPPEQVIPDAPNTGANAEKNHWNPIASGVFPAVAAGVSDIAQRAANAAAKTAEKAYWEAMVGQTPGQIRDADGNPTQWYGSGNLSYQGGYEGQCTWYAYGRFYEKTGIQLPTARHAKYWLDDNRNNPNVAIAASINDIKEPAIAVMTDGKYGHVAIVEHVDRDAAGNIAAVYVTEANSSIWETDILHEYTPGVDGKLRKMTPEVFLQKYPASGYISAI